MQLNKIILGTVQLGLKYGINNTYDKPSLNESFAILEAAYKNGITCLDTSVAYGSSIEAIANFHSKSNKRFEVISKFFLDEFNLEEKVETELKQLQLSNFNTYHFHKYNDFETIDSSNKALLLKLKQEGCIQKIGVSVYDNTQFLNAVHSSLIDVIQFPFNVLDNENQRGQLMDLAKKTGKELHIRSVFLQGLFFKNENDFSTILKPLVNDIQTLKLIAKKNKMSLEYIALYYALQNKNIDKVLIGVDTIEQLESNCNLIISIQENHPQIVEAINNITIKEIKLLNPQNWN
jgi:uncharacterized protein